jgi:hypothetical protein
MKELLHPYLCLPWFIWDIRSYNRWSVGQSVLVSGHLLGPTTNYSFYPRILTSDICGYFFFVSIGSPLWREDGSAIYSYKCCWAWPALSLPDPSPAELVAVSYSLGFLSIASHDTRLWWRYSNLPPHEVSLDSFGLEFLLLIWKN